MTFAVNVLAPYLLTTELLAPLHAGTRPRLINVSSISQSHTPLDFDNLQMEKGFSAHASYAISKLCMVCLTWDMADALTAAKSPVTVNTLDPGTVNTKMLLAGWGPCGMEVRDANDQFWLATSPEVEGKTRKYYVSRVERDVARCANDAAMRARLWSLCKEATGVDFDQRVKEVMGHAS